MLKKIMLVMLFFTALQSQADEKLTIIGLQDCALLPSELDFMEKPQDCKESMSTIMLMISGEDIIGFEKDSLVFEQININDKNYSVNRLGEPTYAMASFPKVSKNGKYGFFGVEIKGLPFGNLNKVKARGHVDLLISSNLIQDAKLEIPDVEKSGGLTLGPIKFISPVKNTEKELGDAMVSAMSDAFSQAFGGSAKSRDGELNLIVEGHDSSVVKFEAYEGDKKLDSGGWISTNNIKTMNFSGYQGGPVTVKIDYWNNVKKKKVSINI